MMKRLLPLIIISICLILVLSGCFWEPSPANTSAKPSGTVTPSLTPSETPSASVTPAPAPTPTPTPSAEPSPSPTVSESGALGDYGVTILTGESVKDFQKKPSIRINFGFTNNGKEEISFVLAASIKAFQGGKELKSATMAKESQSDANAITAVAPGGTLPCSRVFKLISKTAPVDVEVRPFFDYNGESMIKKSFPIQ